tara:strand:- start:525 stop:1355 length:831 start_codon:yes stop_codon:yes gene_type:complete
MDGILSEKFQREGYLVFDDFVSSRQCQALIDRALEITEAHSQEGPISMFTTAEDRRATDEYFMKSGRDISLFFEEEAVDKGGLLGSTSEACNKIGHALHDLDPVFSEFSRASSVREVSRKIGLVDPVLIQSMFIFKNPKVGGRVDWHQDACFLYTDPITVKGFWFALEDADRENGCLWVAPGGHRQGLKRRFIRGEDADTHFVSLDSAPIEVDDPIPLEVPAGTLVVFDGCLPHFSSANRSQRRRCAYTLHMIERSADYPADNWLRPTLDRPWRGF